MTKIIQKEVKGTEVFESNQTTMEKNASDYVLVTTHNVKHFLQIGREKSPTGVFKREV